MTSYSLPSLRPLMTFGISALQKTKDCMKFASLSVINHLFLKLFAGTDTDVTSSIIYLLTRNVVPLICNGLLLHCFKTNRHENQSLAFAKYSAFPILLAIISGKFLTEKLTGTPLSWHHVVGMEVLKKIQG